MKFWMSLLIKSWRLEVVFLRSKTTLTWEHMFSIYSGWHIELSRSKVICLFFNFSKIVIIWWPWIILKPLKQRRSLGSQTTFSSSLFSPAMLTKNAMIKRNSHSFLPLACFPFCTKLVSGWALKTVLPYSKFYLMHIFWLIPVAFWSNIKLCHLKTLHFLLQIVFPLYHKRICQAIHQKWQNHKIRCLKVAF